MSENRRVEIELYDLPRFCVLDWLVQAGGQITEAGIAAGDGWRAWLDALEPGWFGQITVPRDRLVIEGRAAAVERVAAFVRHKASPAGG